MENKNDVLTVLSWGGTGLTKLLLFKTRSGLENNGKWNFSNDICLKITSLGHYGKWNTHDFINCIITSFVFFL